MDDDLRLQAPSPAIDAGDPDFLPPPGATDGDGHPRVLCGRTDPGAYEFGIGDFTCNRVVDLRDYANWDACFSGPALGAYPAGCHTFDFNADGDVDLADLAAFQRSFGE